MATTDSSSSSDMNRHTTEYLNYYIELPHPPHFAVLLNGTWGIGKTFLIKKFLKDKFREEDKYIYISLNGLISTDEIDVALIHAMHPALSWKGTNLAGRFAKTALKFFKADPDLRLNDVVNKFKYSLYVFDDLERCQLPINSTLGYINEFVEHEDSRVIIVANEAEICDKNSYQRRREKIVGKSLEIQPALTEALGYFISLISDQNTKNLGADPDNSIMRLSWDLCARAA